MVRNLLTTDVQFNEEHCAWHVLLLPGDSHLPGVSENAAPTLFQMRALNCLNEDYGNISNEATYFIARNKLLENLDF